MEDDPDVYTFRQEINDLIDDKQFAWTCFWISIAILGLTWAGILFRMVML